MKNTISFSFTYIFLFSFCLCLSCSPVRVCPQRLRWKGSAAGCSLIVWLTAGQLFIFLFIPGAQNRHILGRSRHRQVGEKGKRWMDRCVIRVSDQRFVSWELLDLTHLDFMDSSGSTYYTVDTHSDEYLWPCLHKETLQFLIQRCVYSLFILILQAQSCFSVCLRHRGASVGQLT